jgi:hypothetical protein
MVDTFRLGLVGLVETVKSVSSVARKTADVKAKTARFVPHDSATLTCSSGKLPQATPHSVDPPMMVKRPPDFEAVTSGRVSFVRLL